jgi:hypothetical protein
MEVKLHSRSMRRAASATEVIERPLAIMVQSLCEIREYRRAVKVRGNAG